ncbi:ATP-dependent DNA helicase, chloroplastic [Tanacetum coccineum]
MAATTLTTTPPPHTTLQPPPHHHLLHTSFNFFTPFLKPLPNHHHHRHLNHRITAIATPDRIARFENNKKQRRYNNPEPHSENKQTVVTDEEVDKYIQVVKQQQQRGLRELKRGRLGSGNEGSDGVISYKVDPFSLEEGDYVVHKKVGIGRFMSIRPSIPEGSSVPIDYVYIQYADGVAKLPVKQASKFLYRYNLPNESSAPRGLGRLKDTSVWEKRKVKGKVAIQKMVVDLMEVYLNRLRLRRPPYPKNPAMAEFAAQFPYKPTPDQLQAFIDVDKDLTERETPMDRLICGDVGFGKTEVAQRALFCVVSSGKQAMVLAPTIVLAQQHFGVISERFSRYPNIRVGLMSRFQTRTEREEYFHLIQNGELDIIIGTHSLLGSRVTYDKLGLLIVDEEQRFGVKQKEMIASFKTSVDVLTLSATPIPRTLYLALTGFPPPQEVPIKNPSLELVGKGLEQVMAFLEKTFPDVEIALAHGQTFSNSGLHNCISCVGSGGKGQRGSSAHLLLPTKLLLSPKRLAALEECGDLGQGLQLAERDMTIRGFGNIFGVQQTGDVGNVGIDLFFEMLFESLSMVDVHRTRPVPYKSVKLELDINPRLSSEYINYLDNPIEVVKDAEKAATKDMWSLVQFTVDLRRQYGKEPYAMEVLLKKLCVKRMAADIGISKIYISGKTVIMTTNMSEQVFKMIRDAMLSDIHRNMLEFLGDEIKAELLIDLPKDQLLSWIFQLLSELHSALPALIRY